MGANSANGKIYISAEVIDNFKQLASEVKNGLSQAAKEAKLEIEVDDKSTQQAIETSLKNINNYLSKAKFKKIDYGKILPNFNDFLGDESITGNDKLIATDALEQTLSNIDKYGSKIHQSLINSLDADGVQKYFKQLNSVMEYLVDNFSSNYEQLFNTIATDKGFNFDALFNLDTLVKGKNGYLVEDYFGTVDDLKKNIAKEYKKYDSFGLSDAEYMASLEKIAGLKSALETMTGDGLKDILDDKDLADDINAAVNSIEHDYGKAVADAIKRIELNVSNMILDSLDNMHDIQSGFKSYDINSILNTDNYYNSELDKFFKRKVKEQKTPSAEDVINKTIKGEKESTDYSYVYDNETEAAERLKNKIEEVHKAIDNKTSALETEKDKMSEVVNAEIKELNRLEKKFGSITNQDYSNTPLLTDEGGELFTIYRLVSNVVNPHSPNPNYGGTDFTTTNPDMAKGMYGSNWKQYKANFKAKNPLVLDARNNSFYSLPEDLVENYDTKTQFLLNQLKKEAKSAIKDFNLEFGAQLNFDFGGDFEFYDNVYGDILESNDDYKDYFDRIITASENKEKIITDATKKIRDIQKKLQDKQKEIISNDTLPHWDDFPEGKTHGLDNDMLARWLQTQDVYDAIILENIRDSSEHGGSTVLGTNVLLKDFNKQAYNVSLNDAGGSDAYLKTVEEEVASVYSKVEEKIDSIISKLDGIKFPVNLTPEVMVDKGSLSEIKINDIAPDDFDDVIPDDLGTYVEDFVATVQEKLSSHYIEDVLDFLAYDNNGKFITSNGGHQNDGIYQDDKITAIIRDAEYEGKVKALMPALEEAHKKGANVARILDYIIDDENNLLEIQETASGKLIGGNDDDGKWLEATDEQILKLIKDFKILQETGLYFDTGGKNLLYDKDKGFSIIDLAKPKDKNNIPSYNTNDPADLYEYFNSYGSTLGFSQKLKQNLKLSKKAETKSLDYSSDTSEMLNELADSIDKKIEETFESKKQTLQKALDLIKSKDILLEEDGTFEGFSIESIKEELQNVIDNIDSGAAIPTGIMNYYHEKAQKIIDSAKDLKGLFGELYEEDENEEFEIDSVTEFEADFTDISEPLSTAIDKKVDKVIEEKKEKIQEAAKILESLNTDEYYNDYYDDIEVSYSSLEYFFSHADNFDENEIYKEAQKLIDKYNSLNKIIPEKISSNLSEIEKTIPGIKDFAKALHSKILTSDEIDGVLSGGAKGKDPFSKPSWLKPTKSTSTKISEDSSKNTTKTSIDTAKAKEEVTEANKDLEKSTSPSIEALNKESVALEKIEDNASKAALKKEEFAKAESLVYGATEKTIPMLDDEDTMFAGLDASISNATVSLNNFAEAHNKINRLNDINANIQINNNGDNSQNNSRDNNRNINNKTKPYSSLEQIPNEDIIKNYEDIGGALPNIINKNLKGAINKLDSPSFEDLLEEGYQSYRQSLIRMFESMSEDDLISEYGNVMGDNLSESINVGLLNGITSIDFDDASDILLLKLMEEQRQIDDAKEAFINNVNSVESQYSKLSESKSFYTGSDISIFDLKKYTDKDIDPKGRIKQVSILSKELNKVKKDLKNEFNDEGKISGEVDENRIKNIQELINKYNNLIDSIKKLKDTIKATDSIENTQFNLKKQAETIQKNSQSGKYNKFGKQIQDTINKYTYYDAEGNIAGQTAPQINELRKELENYILIVEKIKTADSDQEFVRLGEEAKEAQDKIKELTEDLKEMSSPVATKNQTTSLAKQISGFMDKNTRISIEARSELESYFKTLMNGASIGSDALDNMAQRFKEIKIAEEQAGRLGGDIFNQMVGKMREGIAYLTTKVSAYEIFNQFRQGFEIIHQFDDALTEMMKVSDETRLTLERYQKTTFDTADAIGTSALQIQNSTADFMRLGMGTNVLCSAV